MLRWLAAESNRYIGTATQLRRSMNGPLFRALIGIAELQCTQVIATSNMQQPQWYCIMQDLHSWSEESGCVPGRALNFFFFFQVRVCGPDFGSVGLANQFLPLKEGSCELKFSKFRGLKTKILAKIEAVEAKISKFFLKGGLVNWLLSSFAWNGTLANYYRRGVKRVFSGPHIPIPPF